MLRPAFGRPLECFTVLKDDFYVTNFGHFSGRRSLFFPFVGLSNHLKNIFQGEILWFCCIICLSWQFCGQNESKRLKKSNNLICQKCGNVKMVNLQVVKIPMDFLFVTKSNDKIQ